MGNATAYPKTAQLLEHGIHRTPHMQQYRQIKLPRQFQLRHKEIVLTLRIDIRHIKIKTNFPHRHSRPLLQALAQSQQIGRRRLHHIERVDTISRMTSCVLSSHLARLRKPACRNSRDDDTPHPGGLRRSMHRIPVGIEFSRIQMTVGINQHVKKGKTGSG